MVRVWTSERHTDHWPAFRLLRPDNAIEAASPCPLQPPALVDDPAVTGAGKSQPVRQGSCRLALRCAPYVARVLSDSSYAKHPNFMHRSPSPRRVAATSRTPAPRLLPENMMRCALGLRHRVH